MEKGGKPDRKPYPLPYGLRNQYGNVKSENSQDYARKLQRNFMFMNSASGEGTCSMIDHSFIIHHVSVKFPYLGILNRPMHFNIESTSCWYDCWDNTKLFPSPKINVLPNIWSHALQE
jgi:hypothetical protein